MRYAQIRSMDISNGEEIGASLFLQGCSFHCKNCFNQSTWDYDGGKLFDINTKNHIINNILNKPYIKRFSVLGGEPLTDEKLDELYNLISDIKNKYPNIKLWIYSGYVWENIINTKREKVVSLFDYIIDGQYNENLKDYNLKFRGSSNQRLIDVQKSLKENKIIEVI